MKYKKYNYILIFILMLIIGVNNVYAENKKTCYYISEDDNLKVSLSIYNNFENPPGNIDAKKWAPATIWQTIKGNEPIETYGITNWFSPGVIGKQTIPMKYMDIESANKDVNIQCPKYIIYTECPGFFGTGWFGMTKENAYTTDSSMLASNAINEVNGKCDYAKYASNYKDGKQITEDMFFADFVTSGLIEYDESKKEYTCADMDALFGSKNNPESIRYLVNQVLGYIRVIVPILIILFGTIDFAKAVLAGKQDNMKKAQTDFIKRLIAGVVVFLVPTIVDIIMELADIVWAGEYIHCEF